MLKNGLLRIKHKKRTATQPKRLPYAVHALLKADRKTIYLPQVPESMLYLTPACV